MPCSSCDSGPRGKLKIFGTRRKIDLLVYNWFPESKMIFMRTAIRYTTTVIYRGRAFQSVQKAQSLRVFNIPAEDVLRL